MGVCDLRGDERLGQVHLDNTQSKWVLTNDIAYACCETLLLSTIRSELHHECSNAHTMLCGIRHCSQLVNTRPKLENEEDKTMRALVGVLSTASGMTDSELLYKDMGQGRVTEQLSEVPGNR